MKTEKLLEKLNALKPCVCEHVVAKPMLDELIAEVEADLHRELAAAAGKGSAHKTITKILRNMKDEPREALKYAWIDSKNRQCICDGYRAFRFTEHMPLPARPDNAAKPIDLDQIFPDRNKVMNQYLSIELPSLADVKTYIAAWKAEHYSKHTYDCVYHFGAGLPSVNAEYLVDLISVFPSAKHIWYNGLINPMYCEGETGDALLLPIRVASNGIDAEKNYNAQKLHEKLMAYKKRSSEDPRYSMSVEEFEALVELSAKIA